MCKDAAINILAFVHPPMQSYMEELETVIRQNLIRVTSIEHLHRLPAEQSFAVALIPASDLTSEQWWSLWGSLTVMEPRPCILVYALRSDFEMWASVLEAGCHDMILAPFTAEKLRAAIESASDEFHRRTKPGRSATE